MKGKALISAGLAALTLTGVAVAHPHNRIKGTRADDAITATDRADWIATYAGNDTVNSLGGRDRIWAGAGNDTIDAGDGNDHAWGGVGDDRISGGAGNDVLRGRPGNDSIDGGEGDDVIWVGSGADVENGGPGNDVLHALANDRQVDTVDCGEGEQDVVWLNAKEHDTAVNCEIVKTVTVTAAQAAEDDK